MHALARRETTVGALVADLKMEQSAVSHHLRVLREAGLVESWYQGAHVVYKIAHPRLGRLLRDVASTAGAVEGVCRCVECGDTLVRPYPTAPAAEPASRSGGGTNG